MDAARTAGKGRRLPACRNGRISLSARPSAAYGLSPNDATSHSSTPNAHTSVLHDTVCAVRVSGGSVRTASRRVPLSLSDVSPSGSTLASPKSPIFTTFPSPSSTLRAATSQCTMRCCRW